MIMCVLLCYAVSIHMSQLVSTWHPISSFLAKYISECIAKNLIFNNKSIKLIVARRL